MYCFKREYCHFKRFCGKQNRTTSEQMASSVCAVAMALITRTAHLSRERAGVY